MSRSSHSSMLSSRPMPLPPPPLPPTPDETNHAHATTIMTTTTTSTTTNANPPPPPPAPRPQRDLTMVEILSVLLPFFVPMPIPLDVDLSDDAALAELLAAVTVGGPEEDRVMRSRSAGSNGQVLHGDGDGDDAADEAEDEDEDEDERVARMPVDEAGSYPDRVGSGLVDRTTRVEVGTSAKGKEKEREEDTDVVMRDEEEGNTWHADYTKDLATRSKARRDAPIVARAISNASASASASDSGVGSNGAVWTPARQHPRPGSSMTHSKSKSKSTSNSNSNTTSSSFSPVDWSKTHAAAKAGETDAADPQVVVVKLSPRAKLVLGPAKSLRSSGALDAGPTSPDMKNSARGASLTKGPAVASTAAASTATPVIPPQTHVPSRSYTLPAPPEGSIAALRQETLGVAYTYPNSYVYGEETVEMVMGADAGERMLSPESESFSGEEEEGQPENAEDEKEEDGGEEDDGDGDDMFVDEDKDKDKDMGVAEQGKDEVIAEVLAGTAGRSASKFVTKSSLALGAGSASTAPKAMMERPVSVVSAAASSLSSLTSVPSSGRASPSASSSSTASASASRSRSGSTAPSRSTSASSAPPPVDLTTIKVGPPAKRVRLSPDSGLPGGLKDEDVVQSDSASPFASTSAASPPSMSGTTEEEAQVQGLVLGSIEASSPVRPPRAGAREADTSVDTIHAGHQSQSPVQRSTPSPTPTPTTQTPVPTASTSRPTRAVGPSFSLPIIDVQMNDELDEVQEPESEPISASSPLFTSPTRPPYGDVNYQGEDFDLVSSPPKAVESERKKIVKAKKELTTPRHVPKLNGMTAANAPSPQYISSASVSPSKPRTTTAYVVDADVASPSPPPIRTSFMRTSPDKKKQKNLKKEKESPVKVRTRRSPSVISISSSDDEVVTKPTAPKRQIQTQAQIQRERRPRPRPVLRKPPVKLEVFDNPRDAPIVIDITTPVRPSVRASRVSSSPPSPVVEKQKQQTAAATVGGSDLRLSLSAPLSSIGSLSPEPEPELELQPEEPMQMEEEVLTEPEPVPVRKPRKYPPELDNLESSESEEEEQRPSSSFDIKKYTARLNDADDDADIVPVKKKRKVSGSMSVAATDVGSIAGTATASATVTSEENIKSDPDDTGGFKSDKQTQPQPKRTLTELIANKNKKQSAALTRVKKRKRSSVPESIDTGDAHEEEEKDDYDQPPLKRAKMRTSADKKGKDKPVSKTAGKAKEPEKKLKDAGKAKAKDPDTSKRYPVRSPKAREKPISVTIKTPTRRPRGQQQAKVSAVVWPTVEHPNFEQFVNCDLCDVWYHIGCVGVEPDDVRLEDTEIYKCPMCDAGVSKEASPVKQVTDNDVSAASRCARPKCLRPLKKKKKKSYVVEEPESFVVEAFVGRYKKFVGGQGPHVEYLVKWHSYGYHEATWEVLENMGLANPGPLLDAFEKSAAVQSIDLDAGDEVVLFQEAADAGWTTDRMFVSPG